MGAKREKSMKRSTVGFLVILVVGLLGVFGYRWLKPKLFERRQFQTSDANVSWKLRIGGDNYLGYWFLTAPEMVKESARRQFAIDFTDDGGAYADRLEKFAKGDYDAIVLPVNSYLEHGARHKFPGVILTAISASKGADGIVAFGDKLPTGKVTDLNDPNLKFVFTEASPSEFLLQLTIADFDLAGLRTEDRSWQVRVGSSREVYERARKRQGDVFVLWEPDLSKALEIPGMKYVWGSDKFAGYITDVFVFRRDFVERRRDNVLMFLKAYFRVLALYANDRERMIKEMMKSTGLNRKNIEENGLAKINWFDLRENAAQQFGIGRPGEKTQEGVVDTIIASTRVMLNAKVFPENPLSGKGPYYIINSSFLKELAKTDMTLATMETAAHMRFSRLDAKGWSRLREVGAMRVEPITFQGWSSQLTTEGKALVDRIAKMLATNYPAYRVVVRGHTGPGNEEVNVKLSLARAESVVRYMVAVHSIDPNRFRAEGAGSRFLLKRNDGESPRQFMYRQERVEFILFEENAL